MQGYGATPPPLKHVKLASDRVDVHKPATKFWGLAASLPTASETAGENFHAGQRAAEGWRLAPTAAGCCRCSVSATLSGTGAAAAAAALARLFGSLFRATRAGAANGWLRLFLCLALALGVRLRENLLLGESIEIPIHCEKLKALCW